MMQNQNNLMMVATKVQISREAGQKEVKEQSQTKEKQRCEQKAEKLKV